MNFDDINLQTQEKSNNPNGIGLALAGGGVRGCIHLGFLEILQQNNIPISHITGTSMGAIIGGAIALGEPLEKIQNIIKKHLNLNIFKLSNFNYFNESLVKGDLVTDILKELVGEKEFKDTKIPFACVALNLESGKEIVFTEGPLWIAIKASSSYPMIFPPVFYKDMYLIDGGITKNIPCTTCREIGAKKLVAVNITNNRIRQYISGQVFLKHYKKESIFSIHKIRKIFGRKIQDLKLFIDILMQCIALASTASSKADIEKAKPDLYIEENVEIDLFDFGKMADAVEQGRNLAKKHMEEIKNLVNSAPTYE